MHHHFLKKSSGNPLLYYEVCLVQLCFLVSCFIFVVLVQEETAPAETVSLAKKKKKNLCQKQQTLITESKDHECTEEKREQGPV